jgi:hypothetical protein
MKAEPEHFSPGSNGQTGSLFSLVLLARMPTIKRGDVK